MALNSWDFENFKPFFSNVGGLEITKMLKFELKGRLNKNFDRLIFSFQSPKDINQVL